MTQVFNRGSEKEKRRELLKNRPQSEIILWSKLKRRQLKNLRFRRQYSIGPYVADFYCTALHLVIELDGDSHFVGDAPEYDAQRTEYMQNLGLTVMRFTNEEVRHNLSGVLETICSFDPSPSPKRLSISPS